MKMNGQEKVNIYIYIHVCIYAIINSDDDLFDKDNWLIDNLMISTLLIMTII